MEKNLYPIHTITPTEKTEISRLDVAARLSMRMIERTQRRVAEELQIPLYVLLDMIEGKREFNRRVLRYLGIKRETKYFDKTDSDYDG